MGLFDSIIGTSTEEAEPLSEEAISDEVDVVGWTWVSAGDDKTSGGGGSGTRDDSTPTKNKKTNWSVDNEIPNIDIGGDMSFSPESEKMEEVAKGSFFDMSEPNNTVVENIVDITTPEIVEIINTVSIDNTLESVTTEINNKTSGSAKKPEIIESMNDIHTDNTLESVTTESAKKPEIIEPMNDIPTENTVTENDTFGEKITQFLGGLNNLRESDGEKINKIETKIVSLEKEFKKNQEELKKIETKIVSIKVEFKKNQEELKKIQEDEKKIDDTIALLNKIK